MKVLAVGAAGVAAGMVTTQLARRGVEVRGLVHSAAREARARANGARETVVADLDDRSALAGALEGVDAVFHVVPAFVPDEAATGLVMVEAAVEAGVRRLVFSSVYHPALSLSNHRDKQPVEEAIYDSRLEFTVLQPAMFMAQLRDHLRAAREHGVITGPYSPASKMAYVDYRDVAEAAAIALTTDRLLGGTFELSGPGEYSREDVARELSILVGRPVRAEGTEPEALDPGMPEHLRVGLQAMFHHYDLAGLRGGNSLVLDTVLGRPATSVPAYLHALAGADHEGEQAR